MGKIIVTENVSLDGVVQDPTGDEGFDRGGWAGQLTSRDRQEWSQFLFEEALAARALLLGRRSDAWFAERWLARSGGWADRLNSMPKYVVSATVAEASLDQLDDHQGRRAERGLAAEETIWTGTWSSTPAVTSWPRCWSTT